MKRILLLLLLPVLSYGQSANTFFKLANAKLDSSLYKDAEQLYTRAIAQDSGFTDAYWKRAAARVSLKDIAGAINDYTVVIK